MTNVATEEQPKKKTFLILAIVSVVLLALAAGGWFFYSQKNSNFVEVSADSDIAPMAMVKKPQFISMPRFVVSVEGESRLHYLMLELSLMTYDPEQQAAMTEMMPVLRNAVVKLLNGKTFDNLSVSGSLPVLEDELRDVLQAQMNEMTGSKGLERVLITKLVVQ
ncbi:flagellar basal body-associated FliL family protein [Enterovibrio makurazakiensis]|uniref:flagellar basal body-associated FliL family protein n=1 Tax=Enterovibrio makurazakiensis TaxID=2910232 RepID=UPI003D1968F0